ncbi:MAG TPA: ATP-binding cassette domain-containing protein [Devosia sp.]|nr:ATP-binding cassette domain-containing protein [Devosia sp.]
MLEAEQLTFAQPGQPLSYVYDLQVAPGEIVVVTGISGAGKSTLLDLIAGFLSPTAGALSLNGDDLLVLPPEKRPVSILFQQDNLFEHLSVAKNLALALPANDRQAKEKIANALDEVGLADYGPRRAHDISGGQKQRVALARTLLRQKPVLLLDEPFASLDDETAREMRALVRCLTDANQWHTLIVSHAKEDVRQLADRLYNLFEGRLNPEVL